MYPLHEGFGSLGGIVRRDTLAMNSIRMRSTCIRPEVYRAMRKDPATIMEFAGTHIDTALRSLRRNAYSETLADVTLGSNRNRTAKSTPRFLLEEFPSFRPVVS